MTSNPRPTSLAIEHLTGDALSGALEAVARLRIAVFREWPYLYDGTLEHEQRYIAEFAAARDAVIIAARDGDDIVGIATGAPLLAHTSEFGPLFEGAGFDPERVFYCGESVLLPAYRGRGVGHAFFDGREAHARTLTRPHGAFTHAAFCGVVRDESDPRRPAGYAPLDPFWRKRGYAKVTGLLGSYDWKDIGCEVKTSKPMQFWMRPL